MTDSFKKTAVELLDAADVKINGSRPWDIRVFDERFYQRALSQGTLGLGESYMDNWWDAEGLDQFFYQVLNAGLQKKIKGFPRFRIAVKAVLLNL